MFSQTGALVKACGDSAWPFLTTAAFDATLLFTVAILGCLCFRGASAATRHRVWMLAVVGLLIVSSMRLVLPSPQWAIWTSPQAVAAVDPVHTESVAIDDAPDMVEVTQAVAADPIEIETRMPDELAGASTGDPIIAAAPVEPFAPDVAVTSTSPQAGSTITLPETVVGGLAIRWRSVLAMVWGIGTLLLLVSLAVSMLAGRRLVKTSDAVVDDDWLRLRDEVANALGWKRYVLLVTNRRTLVPMTAGLLRPVIVLPVDCDQWSHQKRRMVLAHELSHGMRLDVFGQIVARLACAVHWFHPLAWLAFHRLRIERELACDDAVLTLGEPASDYASCLVEMASALFRRPCRQRSAVAMASVSSVEQRVLAILHPSKHRAPVGRRTSWLLAGGAIPLCMMLAWVAPISESSSVDAQIVVDAPATLAAVAEEDRATTPPRLKVEPSHKPGTRKTINIGGKKFHFRWCPPGSFMMGWSKEVTPQYVEYVDRAPSIRFGIEVEELYSRPHEVTIGRGFWLQETEVTFEQYSRTAGRAPIGPRFFSLPTSMDPTSSPMHPTSWQDATAYCQRLSGMSNGEYQFRLPTEAEWEYACRAGSKELRHGKIDDIAWSQRNSDGPMPALVARKQANAWGLHDMLGNVAEWCADWHGPYAITPQVDPTGSVEGRLRVQRGGSYRDEATDDVSDGFHAAARDSARPIYQELACGFRMVLVPATSDAPAPSASDPSWGIAGEPPASTVVYHNKIHGRIGDEWSNQRMDWTANGSRMFLGRFGSEEVDFTLEELPEHEFLRVSFDVLLIRSWDGSSQGWGPDFWNLSVVDGQRLIHTTFTNCGYFSNNNEQAFPDDYEESPAIDWRNHAGFTGALESQTLGYIDFRTRITDSVYRMNLIFPHASDTVTLRFAGDYEDRWDDQTWALDNIKVEAVEAATPLTDEAMHICWNALGGRDPVAAVASIWKMVGSGDQAVAFIETVWEGEGERAAVNAPAADTLHHRRALRVLRLIDSKRAKALHPALSIPDKEGLSANERE